MVQGQAKAGKFVSTPRAVAQTTSRARRIVSLSILSTSFALLVAISTWVHLDVVTLRVGANINHALALVLLSTPCALVLILLLRRRLRLLAFVLLIEAASLGAAIVLVALDSATYAGIGYDPLRFVTHFKVVEHVWELYVLWGAPLLTLLFLAGLALLTDTGQTPIERSRPNWAIDRPGQARARLWGFNRRA
jgi:phosphoglycerol transferase MdoB-like AlkP superfamily enzyme